MLKKKGNQPFLSSFSPKAFGNAASFMGKKFNDFDGKVFLYGHIHDFRSVVNNFVRSHRLVDQVLQQEISVISLHVMGDYFTIFVVYRK